MMLKKRGHTVTTVGNGREAVAAVAREAFDVVLMDIQMPEMDGIAATEVIRATPRGAQQRIVALTAHASGVEKERCLAAGMNDYLTKPFKAHQLFAVVEGWTARAGEAILPIPACCIGTVITSERGHTRPSTRMRTEPPATRSGSRCADMTSIS